MTEEQERQETPEDLAERKALIEELSKEVPQYDGPKDMIVHDNSEFALILDTAKFNHMWRVARLFAASKLVPGHFKNDPCSVFVVLEMAPRLGVAPLMLLQKTYVVGGKPGIEAQLAIALINTRGPFTGPIQWRFEPNEDNPTKCTAFAKHKITKEVCQMSITMDVVKAEGWYNKDRSKWKTMPAQMFRFRTAMWLGRAYCPEVLMGLYSVDELLDGGAGEPIDVTPEVVGPDPIEIPSIGIFIAKHCAREAVPMTEFLGQTAEAHGTNIDGIIAKVMESGANLDEFLAAFDAWEEKQKPAEPTESEPSPPPEPTERSDEDELRALLAKKGVDRLYQRQFPELSVDDIIKALAGMDGGELKAATRKKLIAGLNKQPVDCTLVTRALEGKVSK